MNRTRHVLSRALPAVALCAAIAGAPGVALADPSSATSGSTVIRGSLPFSDPSAHGFIGFCNAAGKPVTSGSVSAQPFVWKSIASVPAPKGYTIKTGRAELEAFQPRQQTAPGDWSGEQITGSSGFTNAAHPVVQATVGDDPLVWFSQSYPPNWNGLVELRMYYSAPNAEVYSYTYPATTIRITGKTWTVVSGGTVNCSLGSGTSTELLTLGQTKIDTHAIKPADDASSKAHASATPTAGSSANSAGGPQGSASAQAAGSSADPTASRTSSTMIILLALLAVLVAAGVIGVALVRRGGAEQPKP